MITTTATTTATVVPNDLVSLMLPWVAFSRLPSFASPMQLLHSIGQSFVTFNVSILQALSEKRSQYSGSFPVHGEIELAAPSWMPAVNAVPFPLALLFVLVKVGLNVVAAGSTVIDAAPRFVVAFVVVVDVLLNGVFAFVAEVLVNEVDAVVLDVVNSLVLVVVVAIEKVRVLVV